MMLTFMSFIFGFAIGALVLLILLHKAGRKWMGLNALNTETKTKLRDLQSALTVLESERAAFNAKAVPYAELEGENVTLKRDLRNLDLHVLKLQMDRDLQAESQSKIAERSEQLAEKYLSDVEKWIGSSITANNYAACKQRLVKTIEWCREIGFEIPENREAQLLSDLKRDYELEVRKAVEKEEQARIKAQIREEQLREREIQRELQSLDRERAAIKAALDKALTAAKETHSEEVERLRARLAEAEARNARAIAQAQVTKAGHIYVISNLGSFGESVFKIGMTRRLEPKDRIAELSDASVPFPFDVHMMISCNNAPQLENQLHRQFHSHRLNKVNLRKEFFRVQLEEIRKFVEQHCGEVLYVADAEALEYNQSVTMSTEDEAYIERVFEEAEQAVGATDLED